MTTTSKIEAICGLGLSNVIEAETRSEFTLYHLNSAKLFFQSAGKIEREYTPTGADNETTQKNHASYVSSAIVTIVAALESNINSLFVDYQKSYNDKKHNQVKETLDLFIGQNVFEKIRDSPVKTLAKYSTYSMMKKGVDIDESINNELKFIINVRNKFIHFTPKWPSQKPTKSHLALENTFTNQYAKKFKPSPFFDKNHQVFPYHFLSAEFADWCIRTIDRFILDFNKKNNQQ